MNKISVLIADDERPAREGVAVMLEGDDEIEIVGSCADGRAALAEIRDKRPELVFLDAQMPGLGGVETLEALRPEERPSVIFVTAHDKYALRAFDLCAVDYLLKPFSDERFKTALERAKERIRRPGVEAAQPSLGELLGKIRTLASQNESPLAGGPDRIGFRAGGDYHIVAARDIVWIEGQRDGIKVCAEGQIFRVRETLKNVEDRLDPARFTRIHRSFMVNLERIKKVSSVLYGDSLLLMSDGTKIPLSRNYRDKLKALLRPNFT